MMTHNVTKFGLAGLLITSGVAFAQAQPAPTPNPGAAAEAPAAAAAESPAASPVKILEVTGTAQHRPNAQAAWQALTTESTVPLGSEVRTGPRSSVRLQVGENSQVKLESLGIMTIADVALNQDEQSIRTRLYKKYGKMTATVQHVGDLRNDYQIATPGATLAVRGSEVVHSGYENWSVQGVDGSIELILREETHGISGFDFANSSRPNPNRLGQLISSQNNNTTPGQESNNQAPDDTYGGLGGSFNNLNAGDPLDVLSAPGGHGGDPQ